jgi:hypothetical protein
MVKRFLVIAAFGGFLLCASASAQVFNNCLFQNHSKELACLIPDFTSTGGSSLGSFNTTIAQALGQLPLAVPISGFALAFDKATGIYVVSTDNLGSVLTERGDTIGKHKIFLGFTYQRFVFETIDGTNLNDLPAVFVTLGSTPSLNNYTVSQNSIAINIDQYIAAAAFGLTDRVDVSITLPFERVALSASQSGLKQYSSSGQLGSVSTAPSVTGAGSASGVGDLLVNLKGTVVKAEKLRLALGTEVRFPTGDELNLLGSGAYGLKPYAVLSRRGRITPHVNLGYQWNGFSNLYPNLTVTPVANQGVPTLRLPSDLDYSAGADVGIVTRLTFVADLLGQHFFSAPRVLPAVPASQADIPNLPRNLDNFPTVRVRDNQSYDNDNLGLGFKVNPIGKLLVSANVLIKLNDGGLRANYVPLVGVSYKF